ncbi:MAG: hypothetical protein RLZZ628_2943, partial [Bacteroidota bacterium]
KAQTWNIGSSWRNKAHSLEFKIDYSKTIVYDRIIFSSFEDDTLKFFNISKLFGLHLKDRDVTSVLFFKNLPTTTTRSVDISFQWKRNTAFQWVLGFNWNQTQLSDTTNANLDRQEASRYTSIIPNFKGFILVHGRSKNISYKLQATLFGQNAFIPPDSVPYVTREKIQYANQVFKNQEQPIIDIELGYHINAKSKITIGCNNLWGFKSNETQTWEQVKYKMTFAKPTLTPTPLEEEVWKAVVQRYGTLKYSDQVQTFGVSGAFIYSKWAYSF